MSSQKSMVVDTRNNVSYRDVLEDQRAAMLMGEAAVTGSIWLTNQQLGQHILERLSKEGFIIVRVL